MTLLTHYAIEPRALGTWGAFQQVFEKLGFSSGRLCVSHPEKWGPAVLALYADEVDRKRVEEALRRHLAFRVVKCPPLGNARIGDWWSGVEAINDRLPLAVAIVRSSEGIRPGKVRAVELTRLSEDDLPEVGDTRVPRTAKDLAKVASELFRLSSRVVLVDPHFDPCLRKFQATLSELLGVARREGCGFLEVIASAKRLPAGPRPDDELDQEIGLGVYKGKTTPNLRIVFVSDPKSGDRVHHRLLVSEIGALQYDAGFAEERKEQFSDVRVVRRLMHEQLLGRYYDGLPDFDVVHEYCWPRAPRGLRLR
jgi:hypothetical protein